MSWLSVRDRGTRRDAHPETLDALDARVSTLRDECGCDAGAVATVSAVGLYAVATLVTGWVADWAMGRVVLTGAAFAFVAGAIAKVARIGYARREAAVLARRRQSLAAGGGGSDLAR